MPKKTCLQCDKTEQEVKLVLLKNTHPTVDGMHICEKCIEINTESLDWDDFN